MLPSTQPMLQMYNNMLKFVLVAYTIDNVFPNILSQALGLPKPRVLHIVLPKLGICIC